MRVRGLTVGTTEQWVITSLVGDGDIPLTLTDGRSAAIVLVHCMEGYDIPQQVVLVLSLVTLLLRGLRWAVVLSGFNASSQTGFVALVDCMHNGGL